MPPNSEDNRYQEPQVQRRLPVSRTSHDQWDDGWLTDSQPLDHVLREYALIPGNQYFLAVLRDDGVATFTSPTPLPPGRISRFFDANQFKHCMQPATSGKQRSKTENVWIDWY